VTVPLSQINLCIVCIWNDRSPYFCTVKFKNNESVMSLHKPFLMIGRFPNILHAKTLSFVELYFLIREELRRKTDMSENNNDSWLKYYIHFLELMERKGPQCRRATGWRWRWATRWSPGWIFSYRRY
jgi:hypothetical protein